MFKYISTIGGNDASNIEDFLYHLSGYDKMTELCSLLSKRITKVNDIKVKHLLSFEKDLNNTLNQRKNVVR